MNIEIEKKFIELWNNNKTYREISKELGLSSYTITKMRKKLNLQKRRHSKEDYEKIWNKSYDEISKQFNINKQYLYIVRHRFNLPHKKTYYKYTKIKKFIDEYLISRKVAPANQIIEYLITYNIIKEKDSKRIWGHINRNYKSFKIYEKRSSKYTINDFFNDIQTGKNLYYLNNDDLLFYLKAKLKKDLTRSQQTSLTFSINKAYSIPKEVREKFIAYIKETNKINKIIKRRRQKNNNK